MKLTFYDKDLNKKEVVFSWLSLLWQTKYNDVGIFTAEFQKGLELWGKIQPLDFVTYDEAPNDIMVVWAIEVKDNKFVVSGRSALSLLENRVSVETVKDVNAEAAMRHLIADMANWEGVILGESKDLPEMFDAQKSNDTILGYLRAISQYCDIGIRLIKKGDSLLFECYKPLLNDTVKYSSKYNNMNNEVYFENEFEYRNVAYVHGQGEGANRILVVVGETDKVGHQRREMYVDAQDIQKEETETIDQYKARLRKRGLEKLSEQIRVVNTTFLLTDTSVKVGDVVVLTPSFFNVTYQARIVEMTIKSQNNLTQTTIGIGTPVPIRRR